MELFAFVTIAHLLAYVSVMASADGLNSSAPFHLFGSSKAWNTSSWTTTDDRVRGGASQSYLIALPDNSARFYGNLDISTLGGAGFASQFSPLSEDGSSDWNLSVYDGIEIAYSAGDGREYTLILKDELPDTKREDGRERAGVNWEVDFVAQKAEEERKVRFSWNDFKATFRGKPKDDAGELRKGAVKRVGIMMRSLFGKQEGDFSVDLKYLCARRNSVEGMKAEL